MSYVTAYSSDDNSFEIHKQRKQHKISSKELSWEQESKNEQHKRQQEKMKALRKAGREAKRNSN